jgi:hypothetical protein
MNSNRVSLSQKELQDLPDGSGANLQSWPCGGNGER